MRQPVSITVINLKGGVGKTHTSWLLAGNCSEQRLRTIAIDLDQQGNLSRNLAPQVDETGIACLFDPRADAEFEGIVRPSLLPHVDCVCANASLQPLDINNQQQWESQDLHLSLVDFTRWAKQHYDVVLFDCPTKLSLTGFAALTASDYVIVPLEPADWGAQGVVQVAEAVRYVRENHNPRLKMLGYLISRIKARRKYQQMYCHELRAHFGDEAFETVIPDLAGFEQAVTHAVPVNIRRPNSKEAAISRQFFAEVQQRIVHHSAKSTASLNPSPE